MLQGSTNVNMRKRSRRLTNQAHIEENELYMHKKTIKEMLFAQEAQVGRKVGK